MAIKASAAREIDALIADLVGAHDVARETAVARLAVIGPRAVERLLAVVNSPAEPAARLAAMRALEGIRDPRILPAALHTAGHDVDPQVAAAAIGLSRHFLEHDQGTRVIDQLTGIALDAARVDAVRLAAIAALRGLASSTVAPLLKALADDPQPAIRAAVAAPVRAAAAEPTRANADALLARAAAAGLPESPEQLREALAAAGRTTTLAALLRIVERVRDREAAESARQREKWAAARAAAHLALAKRRSRIAVYDLREWLASARMPLPIDALAALSLVGDVSCLEPIAARYSASPREWSHDQLADMFRAIVKREGLSKRHPTIKRIERKQKQALGELWPARR